MEKEKEKKSFFQVCNKTCLSPLYIPPELKAVIFVKASFWSDVKMSGYVTQWDNFELNWIK